MLVSIVLGLLLAGIVAPLSLLALPSFLQGSVTLWIIAGACIALVVGLRRALKGPASKRPDD